MHYHLKHFFASLSWGIIAIAMNGIGLHDLSQFTFRLTGWQVSWSLLDPYKIGLPRSRVRGHFTDPNYLLCKGWGLFPTLWDSCSMFTSFAAFCYKHHFAKWTHGNCCGVLAWTRNVLLLDNSAGLASQSAVKGEIQHAGEKHDFPQMTTSKSLGMNVYLPAKVN